MTDVARRSSAVPDPTWWVQRGDCTAPAYVNREISQHTVRAYANVLKEHSWNPEIVEVRLSRPVSVVDGQHRLSTLQALTRLALNLKRSLGFLDDEASRVSSAECARWLRSSAEAATCLPSIPSTPTGTDFVWAGDDDDLILIEAQAQRVVTPRSLAEIAALASAAEALWQVTLQLLAQLCGIGREGFPLEIAATESAPCGVIRRAAPVLPRAPQRSSASLFMLTA